MVFRGEIVYEQSAVSFGNPLQNFQGFHHIYYNNKICFVNIYDFDHLKDVSKDDYFEK